MSILTLVRQTGGDESDGGDSDGPVSNPDYHSVSGCPFVSTSCSLGHQESDKIMDMANRIPDIITFT